jgi:hypothetical protein
VRNLEQKGNTDFEEVQVMNDNVVSINRGKPDDQDKSPKTPKFIADDAFFVTGVMLTFVCPQLVYAIYGGPVPPVVFAAIASIGTIWGVVRHYRTPYETEFPVRKGTARQVPPSQDTNQKKAA